MENIGINPPMD